MLKDNDYHLFIIILNNIFTKYKVLNYSIILMKTPVIFII